MSDTETKMWEALGEIREVVVRIDERQKSHYERENQIEDRITRTEHRVIALDGKIDKVRSEAVSGTKWFIGIIVSIVMSTVIVAIIKGG